MEKKLENAVEELTVASTGAKSAIEAQQLAQAVLNLAHALTLIKDLKINRQSAQACQQSTLCGH